MKILNYAADGQGGGVGRGGQEVPFGITSNNLTLLADLFKLVSAQNKATEETRKKI